LSFLSSSQDQFLIANISIKASHNHNIVINKMEETFSHPDRLQERGILGNTGLSGICSGPKPLAILEDGQLFEYTRGKGIKKVDS